MIRVRRATPADAAAVAAVHVAAWRETYAGIIPAMALSAAPVERRAIMWRGILGDPEASGSAAVFVAEDGGPIVGFAAAAAQRDATLAEAGFPGEIGAIYVLGAHQRRGTGRTLMAAMSRALSDLGHDAASLWVLRENAPARAFYGRLDGRIVGERADRQSGVTLIELAYGWRDLSRLVAD